MLRNYVLVALAQICFWAAVALEAAPVPVAGPGPAPAPAPVDAKGKVYGGVAPVKAEVGAAASYDVGGRVYFDQTFGTKYHSPIGGFGKRVRVREFVEARRRGSVAYGAGVRAGGGGGGVAYGGPKAAAAAAGKGAVAYEYGARRDEGKLRVGQKVDVETYSYGVFGNSHRVKHRQRLQNAGFGKAHAYARVRGAAQQVEAENGGEFRGKVY